MSFSYSANEILPNLWLGSITDSTNKELINNMDIVINCTKDLPFLDKSKKCIRIPVEDNLEKVEIVNLYKYLLKITEFIHKSLIAGKKILVHCFAGKQRSASVICAYIMRYTGLDFRESSRLIQSKRAIVFTPMCNFEPALLLFYYKLEET